MTHRALLYVLLRRLKNGLFRLRERPGRLIAIVLLVALFLLTVVMGRSMADPQASARMPVLVSLLALYLMLSFFGGLGEPGPILPPADVDFVLPGPFRRREILAYHLMRNYAQMLVVGLFYSLFLGAAETPNPVLAYVGVVLCLVVATQLQTGMTMLTASVSERVFGRLRLVSRILLVGVLAVAAVLAVAGLAGASDVSGTLRTVMNSPVARVLFYPAVAVKDLAMAPTVGAALLPLLGLIACVVGTFALVLLFPVNFVETAATRLDRKHRLETAASSRTRRATYARNALVVGAGAVTWLNALTLRRRLRMVVGAVVMLLFVMLFAGVRSAQEGRGDLPPVLFLLAVFPLLAHMPLGFKGHRDYLEAFKTLPVHPTRLALAEVLVPTLVLWVLQASIVTVLVIAGRVEPMWLGAALAVYPVLNVGMIALSDLFQLGRDPRQMGFFLAMVQMTAMMATLMPAVVAGAVVYVLTENAFDAGAAGLVVHVGVDALLLHLLGRRFRAWEPTEGP